MPYPHHIEPSLPGGELAAMSRGYTRSVYVEADFGGFAALVRPDVDLDDTFKAFDTDNQEWLMVNGWICTTEDY